MSINRTAPMPRLAISLVLGCLAALPAFATPAPLPAWDQLSEAQREVLIAPTRERWNADPVRRAQLLERARRWQQLPPEQRRRAHHGMKHWERMSPEQRTHARALFRLMRPMDPAAREAFKAKWRTMTPAQKNAWIKAHPAPEAGDRGDTEGRREPGSR
ncbi:MAG: DUF3106 domain-containing protein [Pseudomonadota bacterium]|nr:DUF3106 domain-containing protein [Pseudomonadota bacterium]